MSMQINLQHVFKMSASRTQKGIAKIKVACTLFETQCITACSKTPGKMDTFQCFVGDTACYHYHYYHYRHRHRYLHSHITAYNICTMPKRGLVETTIFKSANYISQCI